MQHPVSFGQRLRALRIARGRTRQDMADLLGYSRVAYGYYENDSRAPSLNTIVKLCDSLHVSADYLLGLSDTQNVAYHRISDVTGLSEAAINVLKFASPLQRDVVNLLLAEEPDLSQYYDQPKEKDERWNDPDFVSQQYQEYLEQEARAAQPDLKSAAEHLADEWAINDHYAAMTPEDWDALHEAENEENVREIEEMRRRYADADPDAFAPNLTEKEYQHQLELTLAEEEQEKKTSLLSSISQYISYTSGCQLETDLTSAPLTDLHSIRIGTGNGNSIRFPSKEADELMEHLLLQKVLDALRKFKCNFHGSD